MKLVRKNPVGMSVVLLVKLENYDMLFRVSTFFEGAQFVVWKDNDGVDLFWMGRRVDKVYSMSKSGERWWSVPIPAAVKSLLKCRKAKLVKSIPAPEERLPK